MNLPFPGPVLSPTPAGDIFPRWQGSAERGEPPMARTQHVLGPTLQEEHTVLTHPTIQLTLSKRLSWARHAGMQKGKTVPAWIGGGGGGPILSSQEATAFTYCVDRMFSLSNTCRGRTTRGPWTWVDLETRSGQVGRPLSSCPPSCPCFPQVNTNQQGARVLRPIPRGSVQGPLRTRKFLRDKNGSEPLV